VNVHHHSYDAVIVGAGGAGLRAAIEVAGQCRVAVLTKLYPTRSHTGAAQGGMCAALANVEEDSWEWHAFDTVKGADYLGDQPAIEIMCKEAIDAVVELEHFGLPFNRTPEGKIDQRRFGGHTRNHGEAAVRRACYSADRTGHMILQTLFQQCVKRDVTFFNEFQVLDMVFADDPSIPAGRRVAGVVAYEMATGDLHVFTTKAALFASGGFGRMFKISSNAVSLTGDGPGLLYRRGIPMQDMEFFQFHPTGIYKLGILLSEAARGEGDKDGVYLDLTHLPPEQIDEKLPDITDFVRTYLGIEPKKDPIPIQPTAHYAMGGIPTNVDGQVVIDADNNVVPGLYAAGECACVSVHGANRLGTNSLLDIVVFGRRGGKDMARFVADADQPELPETPEAEVAARIEKMKAGSGTANTADLRTRLQAEMTANAMVFRTEESLAHATGVIDELTEEYEQVAIDDKGHVFNYDLTEALELGYLIELAKVTVASARARTESRGAHFRDDHPLREDEHWMKHTLATREDDGGVRLDYKPVIGGNYEPMERKY